MYHNIPGKHFHFLNIGCHTCDEASHFLLGLDVMETQNIDMQGSKHLQRPLRCHKPYCPLCMDISSQEIRHNLLSLPVSGIGNSPRLSRMDNKEVRNKAESN